MTEQLYTARGSQGVGTYDNIDTYGVSPANYWELVMLLYETAFVRTNYRLRPLWTTKANPDFIEELTGSAYGLI